MSSLVFIIRFGCLIIIVATACVMAVVPNDSDLPLADLRQQLHASVYDGQLFIVQRLLRRYRDGNEPTILAKALGPLSGMKGDQTPLHIAAYRGFADITAALIDAGADVHLVHKYGDRNEHRSTALHYAVTGFEELSLYKHGVNLTAPTMSAPLPIIPNHSLIVSSLVKAGANIEIANDKGITPLMQAARARFQSALLVMLESLVSTHGCIYCLERFTKHTPGPILNGISQSPLLFAANTDRWSRLLATLILRSGLKVENGTYDSLKELGINLPKRALSRDGFKVGLLYIQKAVSNWTKRFIAAAITTCQSPPDDAAVAAALSTPDEVGFTALHLAANQGDAIMTEYLLKAGVDASGRGGSMQQTALHIAAANCHEAVVTHLARWNDGVLCGMHNSVGVTASSPVDLGPHCKSTASTLTELCGNDGANDIRIAHVTDHFSSYKINGAESEFESLKPVTLSSIKGRGGWLHFLSPPWASLPGRTSDSSRPTMCDIPHVSAINLSIEEFERNYLLMRRPVLIVGGAKDWPATSKWSRTYLKKMFGDFGLSIGMIPRADQFGITKSKDTLTNFLDYVDSFIPSDKRKNNESKDIGPQAMPCIFEEELSNTPKYHKWLHDDVTIPKYFQDNDMKPLEVMIGPALAGEPFHWGQDLWDGLIVGLKRWKFLPAHCGIFSKSPSYDFFREDSSSNAYTQKILDGCGAKVMECTQQAGDIIYIPRGMSYSTLHVDESVSVSKEVNHAASINS